MASKTKACKACRALYEGAKCPECGGSEGVDTFKGHIQILNPEQSEIAGHLKLVKKGSFALRLR